MEENIQSEVPLSNEEVYNVLNARRNSKSIISNYNSECYLDILSYIESVKKPIEFPMNVLRKVEDLDANKIDLVILSNTNDKSIVSLSDIKKIISSIKSSH